MFLKGNCCDKKYIQQTKFSRSEADNIIADLTFIYPYSKLTEMPKKLSVSQLYRGLNDFDHIEQKQPEQIMLASGNFTRKDNSYDAAFAGTSTHLFMQFCDFDICIKSGTEYEAGRLVDENYISVKNRDFLNHRVLKAFFASDLFNRIRLSEYVKRELRFNVFMKASELFSDGTSSENDSDILVQGVIDCFFKNDDGTYTVMDYKTDRVQSEDILWERYSAQLKLYKKAVEKMTGSRVSKIVIYSFNLGRETEITLTE
ncbi:ATP-dependent helicase/nuclease subunit A [bioreactor metagenome]|uniref:ATP-dependent helicase/nuclease subunit A n=1 Tax=bioreactor metagenome TaxID=1076179 RepID=A0A645G116_9ZZZZ